MSPQKNTSSPLKLSCKKKKKIKSESDQASRSNYQFTGNKRIEEYVNTTWGGNHQIRMNKLPGFFKN